jgi:hypothetical protein
MTKEIREERPMTARDEPDSWLDAMLSTYRSPSVEFRTRCEELARAGAGIQKLRQAKHRLGLPLLGIPALLRSLAAAVGALGSLEAIQNWAGLDLDLVGPIAPASARAWGRLASALGLARSEAIFYLRLTFADRIDPEPLPQLVNFRDESGPGAITVDALNDLLESFSQSWEPPVRADLAACEQALFSAWDEGGPGEP